jgi:sugar lactone lactonase YvrE
MVRRVAWAATAAMAAGAVAVPASAHSGDSGSPEQKTIVEGLVGPSGVAVSWDGTVYVADLFGGALVKVRSGEATTIVEAPEGGAITGVALGRHRSGVTFTQSGGGMNTIGTVNRVDRDGDDLTVLADLGAYEAANNPDQVNSYGFQGLSDECLASIPEDFQPASYTGVLDSNVYAVAVLRDGSRVVADAGGNDLVRVSRHGKVSTVAVLPPIPVTANLPGLPECAQGATYNLEPVPTDVEVGRNGMLYVSALPGGPEDGSIGANGTIFKVNPWTGSVEKVAGGFAGATDLAIGPRGTIYVTELFGGRISIADGDTPKPFLTVDRPNAVEYHDGWLYAAVGFDSGNASVIKVKVGHHR